MYYTGVALPGFPDEMLTIISDTASRLAQMGFILRTGFDDGGWVAFWNPVELCNRYEYISVENVTKRELNIAKNYFIARDRLAWDCMDDRKKNRYARNVALLLGRSIPIRSKFLLCWTPNGAESAIHCSGLNGTTGYVGFFITIARANKIPVINLHRKNWETKLDKILAKIEKRAVVRV